MNLLIDTTQKGQMNFEIFDMNKRLASFKKGTEKLSEEILRDLDKFLKNNQVRLAGLDKILVNPGPGSFSSTRTGVAIANALGLALGIPVAEWPRGTVKAVVLPKYDKKPNITKPRKMSF